jgi:carbamoyltransferase
MRYVGISEYFHDASIAFIDDDGNIEFASQSERYSKIKNDPTIHFLLEDMITEGDKLIWYEDPDKRSAYTNIENYNKKIVETRYGNLDFCDHHISHSANSFYTRPWQSADDTVIMNIDGHGEYQSCTIYDSKFNLLHEKVYPNSVGVVYAKITKLLGFKPLEEEYIVMGMAGYGEPIDLNIFERYINYDGGLLELNTEILKKMDRADLAATVQAWAEKEIIAWAKLARQYGSKLCYAGGVAQNIVANTLIHELFDEVWIPSNPGDGGSALGAAALGYCKDNNVDLINWIDAYLGHDVGNNLNPKEIAEWLCSENSMCGVVSGRAEFGPRALGNRSLLADPRQNIKDTVNTVKQRQKFRPFAPAILEEYAKDYFDGPMNEYMQYTSKAKHDYSSVTHVDGSARVQIVKANCKSILRPILEEFYDKTGVPMLLNTSLNIKGRPICNDTYEAIAFNIKHGVKVFK